MTSYKPEQGRMVRMAAFWSCALLALFGCTSLHTTLASNFESMESALGGIEIPIVSVKLSGAFLVSTALLGVIVFIVYRWQQKPKTADLLIDTEAELKKVTWPTLEDVTNSSFVVVVFVISLMGFLAGADWLLGRVFTRILLGAGS